MPSSRLGRRHGALPRLVAPVAAAAIAATLLVACAARDGGNVRNGRTGGTATEPAPATPPPQGGQGYVNYNKKYPCGEPVTLEQAAADRRFPVFVPNHSLANEARVEGVNNCEHSVRIYFDSGISVFIEDRGTAPPHEAAGYWERQAAQQGVPEATNVTTVRGGVPALILDVKEAPPDSPEFAGGVYFFEQGVHVAVLGDGSMSAATLIEVAESLRAEGAGQQ